MSKRLFRTGIMLLAAFAVAGCRNQTLEAPPGTYSRAQLYDRIYPIRVEPGLGLLEVDATRGILDPEQENLVGRFANEALTADAVAIDITYPASMEGGATAARISQILVAKGVRDETIHANVGPGPYARVSFRKMVAIAPACGKWDRPAISTIDPARAPDFGCATQNNLAAMLARPEDYVTPRAMPLRQANSAVLSRATTAGDAPSISTK